MDFFDDFFGPLNVIDILEGFLRGLFYGDMGYTFHIRRGDKGGKHSLTEAREILHERGVDTFWFGFDAQKMYFRVKNRQAKWAEYTLLRSGVELLNPAFDNRNAAWAGQAKHGGQPVKSWEQSGKERKAAKQAQKRSQRANSDSSSSWLGQLFR